LSDNEIVDIRVGEHAARALAAVADGHIAQPAGRNVFVQRLDRAPQPRASLARRPKA